MTADLKQQLGARIRRQRRRLGLTLDELAERTTISKPYLSLIETGRAPNPPSDEKLRRIERALGIADEELVRSAHLHRTPHDVRAVLEKLIGQRGRPARAPGDPDAAPADLTRSINLDEAYLSGVLHELAASSAGEPESSAAEAGGADAEARLAMPARLAPVINRVSAGYPKDFTDLGYPPRVADGYVGCPELHDPDAFAARVSGDSMTPKYQEGDVVIFSPAAPWRDGCDYFVRFEDGQTTFKRVFQEKDSAGQPALRLQPRNERYAPRVAPSEQVSGLYKAVFQYRRVDED